MQKTLTWQSDGEAKVDCAENYNLNDDLHRMIRAAKSEDQPCPLVEQTVTEMTFTAGGGFTV